jgi:cell division protein FtsQ
MRLRKINSVRHNLRQRFLYALVRNVFFRKTRLIWHKLVKPTVGKMVFALLVMTIALPFLYYKALPSSFDANRQKIFSFLNQKFNIIEAGKAKIIISGTQRSSEKHIESVVKAEINLAYKKHELDDRPLQNIISKIKELSPWIDNVSINRQFPNKIAVGIEEYKPFVVWEDKGKKYAVDKNGHNIEIDSNDHQFDSIIVLSGNDAYKNVNSIFNIFVNDPAVSQDIYSATWVSNRRWDIRFNNGLIVKLPESNIGKAWQRLIQIKEVEGAFSHLKSIDLRIPDKIYLEYK